MTGNSGLPKIEYRQSLNADGTPVEALPDFARDRDTLLKLYRYMVLTRLFDAAAINLQRTGQIGTYASSLGQEAVAVGIGHAMGAGDVLVPMYRETGAHLQRGVRISDLLLYWGGDERGMAFGGLVSRDLPICVPIASQVPHAVGVAYALKYRRQRRVAVCVVGDGGTSKGDFYEAINGAGVWNLPLVFVVANNQWAISIPRDRQSRAETLAQKAVAAGFPGEQVDGNDVVAVRERVASAIQQARVGAGPRLIEALTYRMGDHTTADDATRYRPAAELEAHRGLDPIARLKRYLVTKDWLDADTDTRLHDQCAALVDEEVARYLDTPPQSPESLFDYLYAELPQAYRSQRAQLSEADEPDA
jgi:pyruvate dehydrogenase E1 component alpha subunit